MKKRLLRVEFNLPDGTKNVLDENLMLRVKIKKAALSIQNKATIEVGILSENLRDFLLSNFTAFNKRLREEGKVSGNYVNVVIMAGYAEKGKEELYLVYKGNVVMAELSAPPPNITIRITCYTQQIDKTKFITDRAPSPVSFKAFCEYAAVQMGFGTNVVVDTSINDVMLINPGRTVFVAAALLPEIQNYSRTSIAAYVDDDVLVVKDKDKIIDRNNIREIKEFIGTPNWTEWGAEFVCMYDPSIRIAQGVKFQSIFNPSLNGTSFIILSLEYHLCSREDAFNIKGEVSPAG